MKKNMRAFRLLLASGFLAFGAILFTGCEKCAVCTSPSEDPLSEVAIEEDEICGKGHAYDDQLEIYERTGWVCEEQ